MSGLTECAQEIFSLKIPGQQTQREKILWMQQNRINGTWVRCFQCHKWRYLKNVFDPVDIPDKWQCSMNLDNKFNNCQETQSQFDDNTVIKLKYTAGSLVWVNSNKYSRWPGIVDDDPEYAQFYWLSGKERRACLYHVVFIDLDYKSTSRQWFSEDELVPFTWHNSQIVPAKQYRLAGCVRLAREALDMNVFQRLQKFSFARRYRGHIFSFGHAMRSFVVSEGQELECESDCTLLSCTDSEDEDYYKNLRDHLGFNARKKKGVISPYDYFKRLQEKKLELESDSDLDNNNRIERANSIRPSENDLRRRRASSIDLNENTLKRTSLDHVLPRIITNLKQKTPGERASSISPKERPFEYSLKENKKRDSMGPSESKGRGRVSPAMRDDFNSRNKRSPVVCNIDSKSRNKRSSSVFQDVDSKSRNKRSSSVIRDVDSKSRNKRSSSVVRDVDSKSRNKRSSSVIRDVDSKSRNKRSSSVIRDVDSKSRNKRSSSVVRDVDSKSRNKSSSSVVRDVDSKSRNKRSSSVVRDVESKSRNKRSSSVIRDVDSKSRNKRSSSVIRDVDSKSRNKRSSSVVRDVDSKSRNKRSSSVVRDVDSKSRNKRSSSVVRDVESKSRNKRSSSVVRDVDSKSRNKSSSSVFRDIDSDHRNIRASPVSYDESQNDRKKRKAALAAPDDYFKTEASNKRPTSLYQNDSSAKAGRKSLDSSGYNDQFSRSRKDISKLADKSIKSKGSDYESNSRSRKDSSKNARFNYECNSRSRKDISKVADDFSEKRRGRRAASVAPINYCETNSRGKRSSSVAPVNYCETNPKHKRSSSVAPVKRRESSSTSKRSSFIAPVDYYCASTPKKEKTTPTVSMLLSGYHNKDGGYHSKDYSELTQQKKTPTASSSQTSYLNRETPKFHLSGFSNSSGRRLRSQTKNNVEENYEMSTKNDSMDMNNSLVIRNTSPITNRLSSNIPIYGHDLIRKVVYEVTTKRWKYTSSNGEYYYRDIVTESRHSRPY